MSIDAKDHRRFVEGKMAEANRAAEAKLAEKELLAQAESPFATTGDDKLDKVIRAIQEVLNTAEIHVNQVAHAGIGCVNDELIRKHQAEYFFTQGSMKAYTTVFEVIARVVTEAKQSQNLALIP